MSNTTKEPLEMENVLDTSNPHNDGNGNPWVKSKKGKIRIAFSIVCLSLPFCLCIFLLVSFGLCILFMELFPGHNANSEVQEFLESTENIIVERRGKEYLFFPKGNSSILPQVGFIFYPGGSVQNIAYSPYVFSLVENLFVFYGIEVMGVLLKSPLHLSFFDNFDASSYFKEFVNVKKWAIAGHSLGGVSSSKMVERNLNGDSQCALVLLASYPSSDISSYKGFVLSLSGENDLVTTSSDIQSWKKFLPDSTTYFEIAGANHAQFGFYGHQRGDGTATIDKYEQLNAMVNQTSFFLVNGAFQDQL